MVDLIVHRDKPIFDTNKHYLGKICIRGHDYQGSGNSWRHIGHRNCVQCTRDRALSWKAENPDRAKQNTKRRDAERRKTGNFRRKRWPILLSLAAVARRSRDKNIPYNLNADYVRKLWVEQDGRCYWTGATLDFDIGQARHPLRPSIDRLEPKLGYIVGNVVWSSNFANRARGDLPIEEFRQLLDKICGLVARK